MRSDGEATWDYLVELVGLDAATRLSEARGGRNIHVPHAPGPHSPLVAAVGAEAAATLAGVFGGNPLSVPIGPGKRARIRTLRLVEKWSIDRIAADQHCTRRHVFAVLAEEAPEPETPPLLARMGGG